MQKVSKTEAFSIEEVMYFAETPGKSGRRWEDGFII